MIKGGAPLTAGRSFLFFRRKNSEKLRKTAKNCEKQEKERLRTQKKHSNPLQFANNA